MAVLLLGGIAGFIICLPLIIAYEVPTALHGLVACYAVSQRLVRCDQVLHKIWGKSAPVADSQLLQVLVLLFLQMQSCSPPSSSLLAPTLDDHLSVQPSLSRALVSRIG